MLTSVDPLKYDNWDLPGCLLLVPGEKGHHCRLLIEQALTLLPFSDSGARPKTLGTQLDRDLRVGYQIMVPVRMGRRTPFRGDHDDPVAVTGVVQGRGSG